MTLDELKVAYPGCPDAVEVHEDSFGADDWETVRGAVRAGGLEVAAVAGALKSGALRCLRRAETAGWEERVIPERAARLRRGVGQMGHPDFLRYVTDKIGAA